MGTSLSLLFGVLPAFCYAIFVYWLDRYEKEPKVLLGAVFVWGAVVAAGGAFILNTVFGIGVFLFTNSEAAANFATASISAPLVEESLKGAAVLMVFIFFYKEFDSLLDGIVYAGITALGFAAVENSYYIYQYGYAESGVEGIVMLAIIRNIIVGWQHPFYTAFIGIGLATARLSRQFFIRILAPIFGWSLAVFTHALHNTLAGLMEGVGWFAFTTLLDWSGWFFMFLVIIWAISQERKLLQIQLREEIGLGSITPAQYKTACSATLASMVKWGALFSGRYWDTRQFYILCAKLAHKKQQYQRLGNERGNREAIEKLRAQLVRLSPRAKA